MDQINHSARVTTDDHAYEVKGPAGLFSWDYLFALRSPLSVKAGEQVICLYLFICFFSCVICTHHHKIMNTSMSIRGVFDGRNIFLSKKLIHELASSSISRKKKHNTANQMYQSQKVAAELCNPSCILRRKLALSC